MSAAASAASADSVAPDGETEPLLVTSDDIHALRKVVTFVARVVGNGVILDGTSIHGEIKNVRVYMNPHDEYKSFAVNYANGRPLLLSVKREIAGFPQKELTERQRKLCDALCQDEAGSLFFQRGEPIALVIYDDDVKDGTIVTVEVKTTIYAVDVPVEDGKIALHDLETTTQPIEFIEVIDEDVEDACCLVTCNYDSDGEEDTDDDDDDGDE